MPRATSMVREYRDVSDMNKDRRHISHACIQLQDTLTEQRPDIQWTVLPRRNEFNHWLAVIEARGTTPRRVTLRERNLRQTNVAYTATHVITQLKL